MEGEHTFGPYVLQSELGRGAMGVVYAAAQSNLDRTVALKVMRAEYAQDEDYRQRFAREAASLARLDSPHVIHIYDFGEHDSQLYIAYQLVGGGNLEDKIRAMGGSLPLGKSLELATQVCSALRDAHAVHVVHRDVKPSNVLLRSGEEPFAYLCDFGIARVLDSEATSTQGVIGTVTYMAPERFDGLPASPSSDLYSLGCLFYAMLSGHVPYAGTSTQVMLKHVQAPIPTYRSGSPVDLRINEILRRSMAKDPRDRYPTAEAMLQDLAQARSELTSLGHQSARPVALYDTVMPEDYTILRPHPLAMVDAVEEPDRASKPRRPWLVGAIGGALALAVLGLAVIFANLGGGDAPPTSAKDTSAIATATADASLSEGPSPSASPSVAPIKEVTCWDQSLATDLKSCGSPTGVQGIAWVFPSFSSTSGCRRVVDSGGTKQGKKLVMECSVTSARGGEIVMRFSEWYRTAKGFNHYKEKDNGTGVRRDVKVDGKLARDVWNYGYLSSISQYSGASMYADHPFSVSVETDISADLTDALTGLIKFRKPSEMRGIAN